MPVKITPDDAYDEESDTLWVGRHGLERLLLEFRALVAKQEPGSWTRMTDYDLSFERLADAVDAATATRRGAHWEGPDLRMRCTTTEAAYTWPTGGPYDGGTPVVWNVPGYGSTPPPAIPGAPGRRRCAASAGRRRRAVSWTVRWTAASACARSSSVPNAPAATSARRPP
ncbi:hypothetical protein [Streptomyces sp. NPDC093260]|uniref:hypothetical protein n=1 Tax=Streptomyces sp. NPDC093260 TaxID=3155073 RepID=UPI003445B37E